MEKKRPSHSAVREAAALSDGTAGSELPVVVVGIGAAAGALKSLKKLLAGMPSGQGVAFVLIHHPEVSKRNLVNLLKSQTALDVIEAADGMTVLADRIHVMPPDRFLNIASDRLTLQAPVHCNGLLMPIDHFFCSLASDRRTRCGGIILSGDGSDGTLGLSEIRAAGGRTLVEDPKSAEFSGMPQSAINAGVADTVLPAEAMAEAVVAIATRIIESARHDRAASPEIEAGLRPILDILRAGVGHDFRCYKPSTLVRRIRRRMTLGRFASMDDYARHLLEHPDEVALLQKDLLIGVTDFFRQPPAWEILEKRVIAQLMENAPPGSVIRVWVPGCSSGKEVYSLAMLLTEQTEKAGRKTDFQIFATDADFAALAKARIGSYAVDRCRRERLGRAAQKVLFPPGRPLSGHQEHSRADRVRRAEHHRRSALLPAGSDHLPQSPDLSRPAGAEEDHRLVSFRVARRGLSVFRQCRDDRGPGGSFRAGLEEMADLSPHRRRTSHQR